MKDYKHPLGNIKIRFIKFIANTIGQTILFILSFFLNINKKKSEIIISSAIYAPWKDDIEFKLFSEKIISDTLLDLKRLYTLWYFSKSLKNKEGNILDIGCLKGGAGFAMSKINRRGNTYLIDTFDGLVENENYHKKGHFVFNDIDFVKNKIKELKLKNTKVIKGKFPQETTKYIKGKKYKLCHIDVNTFNSTKLSFNYLRNKIIKDGIIIFDDYGIYSTDSIKKFVDHISKKFSKDFTFINNYMGQCILIKK
tara:strand:+ start:2152 stop:2910 length:759 start_codon:yes stop_codon:yes gene_type:complete